MSFVDVYSVTSQLIYQLNDGAKSGIKIANIKEL